METRAILAKAAIGQIVLLDVQGLWGGRNLWVSADGITVCQVVGKGCGSATRYGFTLTPDQAAALAGIVEKHKALVIKTKDRPGLPDEARPIIFAKIDGKERAAAKWANDKCPDFDPVYALLLAIAETAKNGTQQAAGPYDWDWRPEGFPENKTVREMTAPKPGSK